VGDADGVPNRIVEYKRNAVGRGDEENDAWFGGCHAITIVYRALTLECAPSAIVCSYDGDTCAMCLVRHDEVGKPKAQGLAYVLSGGDDFRWVLRGGEA
jgi:hypothetical protein